MKKKDGNNGYMKYVKYVVVAVVVVVIGIVFVMMPKTKTMKCSADPIKGDNYTVNNSYVIYYNKDDVKKIKITKVVDSKNNTILSFFEKNYTNEYEEYDKGYGGYSVDSKIENKKMTFTATLNMSEVKMDDFLKKNAYLKENIKDDALKLDGVYKLLQINKNKCK